MTECRANTLVDDKPRVVTIDQEEYSLLMAKARVCIAVRDWIELDDDKTISKELRAALSDLKKLEKNP